MALFKCHFEPAISDFLRIYSERPLCLTGLHSAEFDFHRSHEASEQAADYITHSFVLLMIGQSVGVAFSVLLVCNSEISKFALPILPIDI